MQNLAKQLPAPSPPQVTKQRASAPRPSVTGFRTLETRTYAVDYPEQWHAYGNRSTPAVTIAPDGGLVRGRSGGISIGHGAVLSYYQPQTRNATLSRATNELLQQFRRSNADFQVVGGQREVAVDGSRGLLTPITSRSPYGGPEDNTLLTVARPEGLFYIVFVAPSAQSDEMQSAYTKMIDSLRFGG